MARPAWSLRILVRLSYYVPEMQDPGDGDMFGALADVVCEYAGHEWVDAGGGVDICGVCEAMRDRPDTEQER
jgi:hypothetical protein